MLNINEKDWRLFKERMPDWQERYMAQLNEEYIKLLSADVPASHKFWGLEKRINRDKRNTGVIAEMKRSNMYFCIIDLLKQKTISVKILTVSAKNWSMLLHIFTGNTEDCTAITEEMG